MFPVTSLPENSNDSAGSSEIMSSMILAMTTVSLGVAARAGPAIRTIAATSQVILFIRRLLSVWPPPRKGQTVAPGSCGPRLLTHDRGGTTACQARAPLGRRGRRRQSAAHRRHGGQPRASMPEGTRTSEQEVGTDHASRYTGDRVVRTGSVHARPDGSRAGALGRRRADADARGRLPDRRGLRLAPPAGAGRRAQVRPRPGGSGSERFGDHAPDRR